MLCYMKPSHTNTHTVRGRPAVKKEIRRFRNGLVRERKVNERKLLRQSKTLCSNRRHQFVQCEDYTSYMEKRFAKGICLTFNTIVIVKRFGKKSNSKEKEVLSIVLCVDQPIDCQQEEEKRIQKRIQDGGLRGLQPPPPPPPIWEVFKLVSLPMSIPFSYQK